MPGRVLHLVTDALPTTSAGYTIRTHEIALAQRVAGLDPHVATRAGYPVTQGRIDGRRLVELGLLPVVQGQGCGELFRELLPVQPADVQVEQQERSFFQERGDGGDASGLPVGGDAADELGQQWAHEGGASK